MTVFESFKANNIDELAEWLDKYIVCIDEAPWTLWWDKNYCKKCAAEVVNFDEYGYCELHDKCRFFQDMYDVPDNKCVIKLWLESENDIV